LTWPPAEKSLFVGQLFSVIVSAAAGIVLGLFCLFAARSLAERHWQPSTRYSKAKQYLDANWMWKQILQREYGYESYRFS
jgi:hypothetical protein